VEVWKGDRIVKEAVYICEWCEKEFDFDHAMKNKDQYWKFFYCSPQCYINSICEKWNGRSGRKNQNNHTEGV